MQITKVLAILSKLLKKYFILFVAVFLQTVAQAGTWGTMNFNSGKWGAIPDVYTITKVEPGKNLGELVVFFSLEGGGGGAPETTPTSFSVTCDDVTVVSNSPPVTLTGLSLSVGVDYTCTVVATNAAGSSSASTKFVGTPRNSNILKFIMAIISSHRAETGGQ